MPRSMLALLLGVVALGSAAAEPVQDMASNGPGSPLAINKCLSCHEGIETINAAMDARWQAGRDCAACHHGDPNAATKAEAHDGLIARPGDLRVVMDTCGTCHSEFGRLAGLKIPEGNDQVDRVLRSPMALAPGEIAAVRYLWGEQTTPRPLYGVRSIAALAAGDTEGTVSAVAELPSAQTSPADHLLRTYCLQCHLWTLPEPTAGVYRGAGCAACHVPYAADGRSRSGDPTISKVAPGHPLAHQIVRYVPDAQCLACHRDSGLSIGWNYLGWLAAGTVPASTANPDGPPALPVPPDVHAAAGMACIDCHDSDDVHGDGHLHVSPRSAVGVRCATCHGTPSAPPTLRTVRGDRLAHLRVQDGRVVLRTKLQGEELTVPRIDTLTTGPAADAHAVAGHRGANGGLRLACVACHAGDIAPHYLREFALDERQAVDTDWGQGRRAGAEGLVVEGRWEIRGGWTPVEKPMLGVTAEGEVYPLVPIMHGLRTIVGGAGEPIEEQQLPRTADGHYGFGFRPADPHRTRTDARSCTSCHGAPAAFGLGSGRLDPSRLAWPLRTGPDQLADGEGTAIAAFTEPGARPLNVLELKRAIRRPACVECHVKGAPSGSVPLNHTAAAEDARHRRRVADVHASGDASASPPGNSADAAAAPGRPGEGNGAPSPPGLPASTPTPPTRPPPRSPERGPSPVEPPADESELSPFVGR